LKIQEENSIRRLLAEVLGAAEPSGHSDRFELGHRRIE
jgi:hypothetical protein